MSDADDPDGVAADDTPAEVVAEVAVVDEQTDVEIDAARWSDLARRVLEDEGRGGELALTFVGRDRISELNREHMGVDGPTDVLSFPLDADPAAEAVPDEVPVLLGDVVICPAVAVDAAPTHAGAVDDELALLVVHGVLHVLGHDHADDDDAVVMRERELHHLTTWHWSGPPPAGFSLTHRSPGTAGTSVPGAADR